jgi:hypothetical protein
MLDNEWYLGVGFRGRISHQYPSGSCWFNQIGNVYRFDLYERAEVGCVADTEMEEWSDSLGGVHNNMGEFHHICTTKCGTAPAREAEEAGKDSASSGVGVFAPKVTSYLALA